MRYLLVLCSLLLAIPASSQEMHARMSPAMVGGKVAATASCGTTADVDFFTADTADWQIANTANLYYSGQNGWSDASNRTVCTVKIKLSKAAGSITGKTFVFRIWTVSTLALDTNICSSAGFSGNDAWSDTAVTVDMQNCTGASCSANGCALTGGTSYSFTMDMGGTDASNYAYLTRTGSSVGNGQLDGWDSTKASKYAPLSYDVQFQLFYYD